MEERARLKALEALFDPTTTARIVALPTAGGVVIAVEASPISHYDLMMISGDGRVAQPFGFRPHGSERAAFPHSAPPEGYPTRAKETSRGRVIRVEGKGKRSCNALNRSHVSRRWLRRRSTRYQ